MRTPFWGLSPQLGSWTQYLKRYGLTRREYGPPKMPSKTLRTSPEVQDAHVSDRYTRSSRSRWTFCAHNSCHVSDEAREAFGTPATSMTWSEFEASIIQTPAGLYKRTQFGDILWKQTVFSLRRVPPVCQARPRSTNTHTIHYTGTMPLT